MQLLRSPRQKQPLIPPRVLIGCILIFALTGEGFAAQWHPTSLQKLTVSGRTIVAAGTGDEVVLRGVSMPGGIWNQEYARASEAAYAYHERDVKNLAAWGANCLVLYMAYSWFTNADGYLMLDQILTWCRANALYIVPTLAVYPDTQQIGTEGFFQDEQAQEKLRAFWVAFAQRYGSREEIAGYEFMYEPYASYLTPQALKVFQESLIDSVRAVDAQTIIFVPPYWGDPDHFIKLDRANIVYKATFLRPFSFTSQGIPWMACGGIPTDLVYPGVTVMDIVETTTPAHWAVVEPGTYDWQAFSFTAQVPANDTELVYLEVFSDSDPGATVAFDRIEYRLSEGAEWTLAPNGSFEVPTEYGYGPAWWQMTFPLQGQVQWTQENPLDGDYCISFNSCTGWASLNLRCWLSTLGGIPVEPGQTLAVRFMARTTAATAAKNGIRLHWCKRITANYTAATLREDFNRLFIAKSVEYNAPVMVGEICTSKLGIRTEMFDYLADALALFNELDISWSLYSYRDVWPPSSVYYGIYNGPVGASTEDCAEDVELKRFMIRYYAGNDDEPITTLIALNRPYYQANDRCLLNVFTRTSMEPVEMDLYLCLDLNTGSDYWLWPHWNQYPPLDFERLSMPANSFAEMSILDFTWPVVSGSASGLRFWAAALNNVSQEVMSVDTCEFAYGE